MKRTIIHISMLVLLVSAVAVDANAQQRRGGRRGNPPADQTQQQNNNNNPPTGFPTSGNIPIRIDSSGEGGGLDTNIRKGLRPDGAFEQRSENVNQRTPLPYEHLRWDDALYAEKVWRELDLREKLNQSFRFNNKEDNGDQTFINILMLAVKKGEVLAFKDERFTQPMTWADVQANMGSATADTTDVPDLLDPTKIAERVVTPKSFDTKSVMKLRIKEEWVFDREASRMFCRIVGLCPLKTEYIENTKRERGQTALFWIYYPDLRPTLARYDVYNSKNMGASRMTWEELFESRMFSSYIVKSTLDNPSMKNISVMIKDPILRLLEGDNIKDRIFNFEQDLWSY
jgi:gliding motility associated protien GldN